MTSVRVAIVGAGIAGPVLAMLLKQKGYEPVLYERTETVTAAGLSLVLQPNGLKVLRLVPGLLDVLSGQRITHNAVFSTISKRTVVLHDAPSHVAERYDLPPEFGMRGVQREQFHRTLIEQAEARGIPIHWGHHLNQVVELCGENLEEDCVGLRFANGAIARASFVVGCDGLHSNTRASLFGELKPDYTGLVQTGGFSLRPQNLKEMDAVCNFLSSKAHMVAYPVSEEYYSWAVTQPEEEHKETWRSIDEERKAAFKNGPFSQWSLGAGEMVRTATKIVKYGLYDRPELKTWYKGRVVLLGDAAHPTTPHLGQGANQAFEDIYHLVRTLALHHTSVTTPPTTSQLTAAFSEYERIRLPRSSELVRKAHARGELRVADLDPNDAEAVLEREEAWKGIFDSDTIWKEYDVVVNSPYEGESEV